MRRGDDERGSLAVELSVLAPILIAFMLLVVFAGRVAQAESDVRSAAQEGARAASLRASPGSADAAARTTVDQNLAASGVACRSANVSVDVSDLQSGGQVAVTVRCTTSFSDLAMVGAPGTRDFESTAVEVVDTYRGGP
ncbi:pilus assembly protein [soil metagenome]|jgi:Flp pilus assembly protein TadG